MDRGFGDLPTLHHEQPPLGLQDRERPTIERDDANVVKLDGVKGGGPFRLQYSPDGSRLLTTTLGVNVLNVFDAANLRGKQLVVPVGRDPFGVAFTRDGKTALVSNHGDGTITVVDVATGTVKSSFTAGTGIETLSYF